MPERAKHYAKQRRDFALIMSGAWITYGAVLLTTYPEKGQVLKWVPGGFFEVTDLTGLVIMAFGAVAGFFAWRTKHKCSSEHTAYAILVGAPFLMGVACFIGGVVDFAGTAWVAGTRYWMFAMVAYFVAGLKPSDAQIQQAQEANSNGT